MKNDFKPLQRLQDGSWLVTFSLNHRDADTGELKPRMHQVAFTSKPTIEDDCPYRCADSGRFPGLG